MKKSIYILFLFFTTLIIISCNKSEWKKPTEVTFFLDLNKETGMDGNLYFTEGHIILRSIAFDGNRIQADEVYFESEFDAGLKVDFSSTSANSNLVFDIPQGTYSAIRIDLEGERSDNELIFVKGNYINSNGDELPVHLELNEIEFSDKIAKTSQGEIEIDLVAGNPTSAVIKLDPLFWFEAFSQNQLDNAETSTINGTESILINSENNENLFDLINDRIGSNEKVIFD